MKKKIATVWLAGCSGCHMSLLDIDERILDVVKLADIVKSPIVDGKEFPQVDVALIEGAIASDEHLREILHIRRHAKVLVAFGDCAVTGNVSAMRNFVSKDEALKRAYVEAESNEPGTGLVPGSPEIQKLIDRVSPLNEIIKVDYYLPGCPPSADLIFYVLKEILHDRVPDLTQFSGSSATEGRKIKYG